MQKLLLPTFNKNIEQEKSMNIFTLGSCASVASCYSSLVFSINWVLPTVYLWRNLEGPLKWDLPAPFTCSGVPLWCFIYFIIKQIKREDSKLAGDTDHTLWADSLTSKETSSPVFYALILIKSVSLVSRWIALLYIICKEDFEIPEMPRSQV